MPFGDKRASDHNVIAKSGGRVTVSLAERPGEIFFVRKAAGKGDRLDRKAVFRQQLQRLVHTQLDDILLGRYPKAL